MGNIIEVENLVKKFNGLTAVDSISFTVEEGEIFSLLGPNGAGKTTTINILTTLLKPDGGKAFINGVDVVKDPNKIRHMIGVTFQELVLDNNLTVWETLDFHGRLYNIPKTERHKKIKELLSVIGLEDKAKSLTKTLSGGMKRKLEIVRGLMNNPKVLFLDEPSLGLDPQSRLTIWDEIRKINSSGVTIFMTTHYMDEADMLSNKIAIMNRGRIVAIDNSENLKSQLGRDLILLRVAPEIKSKTIEILKRTELLKEIKETSSGLILSSIGRGSATIPKLIKMLDEENIIVDSIELKRPTLDDVFLFYTGREIKEGNDWIRNLTIMRRTRRLII
ncbi:MAG: ATP-binding cassette domain-containing protein [Candidatus Odinarchaeum yellowstonii]|uniref:ATP-binding cassette domain-containing protein n=1 Tax=Odinarchaeota yellowstonii (strain LCB_4) TaxID=1841599 RepID=A0AAF0D2X5_ODILC|nr:MAG: ATP-binding cassette domain-containing protein [Candidatus Odinarchaeum yellowstonii]